MRIEIALFSLILIFGTGTEGLLNLGDSLFPFFPQERLERLLYVWNAHNILGKDDAAMLSQIPWYGLAALLDKLGVPLWLINRLWFALPFFLLGLAMYFLSGVILGRKKKFSRLVSTLFFMFNPITLNLCGGSNILALSFAAGVFVFGLFVRGLSRHIDNVAGWRDALLIGLVSIFSTANILLGVITALLCAAYLLFFLLVNRSNWQKLVSSLKFVLCAMCYMLLANAWWLIPFLYQITNSGYFQTLFAAGTDVGTLEFEVQFTSLFYSSRLLHGYTPTANFPISHYYHYLLSPTMMSVLVVLAFVTTLFKKKSKFEVFFLLLAWTSVILASGTRPPFGFVYRFLWDHIPYFHIFRTTSRFNFYTMISYAILLGFLCQRLRTKLGELAKVFIIISIFLSAWPLLSGNLYEQLKPHQIPRDYYDLREFLQNQKGDFRVMNFPLTTWLVPYSWSAPFDMQEILIDFSPKNVIVNPPGYLQDLESREVSEDDPVYALVYKHSERGEAVEALRLMGVRYLVVHRDYVIVHGEYSPVDVSELTAVLQEAEGIEFVRSFGDLDVYEVGDYSPRIYAKNVDATTTPPLLTYRKINPTRYQIDIKGAQGPYDLVFGENFNPGWRLSSVGKPQGSLERTFGNVWHLDKTGSYNLKLAYWPQKLFDVGSLISILSMVSGLGVLVYFVVAQFTARREK